jgi:CelD/BcsL family acetyltransferase involved in cellulose biosynthesis
LPWTRVATSLHELEELRSAWEHLYDRGSYTVFQSFEWNRLAAHCFADRLQPHVVCCQTGGGLALIPAAITASRGLTLLGEEMFDYRDLLWEGDEDAVRKAWEVLALLELPLSFHAVTAVSSAPWRGFELRPYASAPQVYAAATSASQFVEEHPVLRRAWQKLRRLGAVVRQHDGSAADVLRWICCQKSAEHTVGMSLFADPQRADWLMSVAAADPAACGVFTLEIGSHIVAGVVTFLDFGVRRFYTIYYDRAWRARSPGNALLFEVTRRSLEQELDCDYMTGEQPFKLRLANGLLPLYRVHASAEQLAFRGQQFRLHAA